MLLQSCHVHCVEETGVFHFTFGIGILKEVEHCYCWCLAAIAH